MNDSLPNVVVLPTHNFLVESLQHRLEQMTRERDYYRALYEELARKLMYGEGK